MARKSVCVSSKVSFLVILTVLSEGLTETSNPKPSETQTKADDDHISQQEQPQASNRNKGILFLTNPSPNRFQYRRTFEPRKNLAEPGKGFSSFLKDFSDFPKHSSFEEIFKFQPSQPVRPNSTPRSYKFNPSTAIRRPLVYNSPQYANSRERYENKNNRFKSSILEYGLQNPNQNNKNWLIQNRNSAHSDNSPYIRKHLDVREDPQNPYEPAVIPIYHIPRRHANKSPPKQTDSFRQKAPLSPGFQQNNGKQSQRLSSPLLEYLTTSNIFGSNENVDEYPKVFKFNEKRINIVEFDRDKKNGLIENLEKGDSLDPENIPRNRFLIFHGGVYEQDDTLDTRGIIEDEQEPFKPVQLNFSDFFNNNDEDKEEGFIFYRPL
ncbi:uncharacterized protein LOC143244366 isoform X2 [Tachypleus tridentatus]|uniref:uncharacterized protein LOC143244366 isoform X2 n=1 Tax=Tachypleus tridentatus TaxID=6853 RepID=UPI003FD66FBD